MRPDLAKFRIFDNILSVVLYFLGLVSIWQHCEPAMAIFMICIGQILMVVILKIDFDF